MSIESIIKRAESMLKPCYWCKGKATIEVDPIRVRVGCVKCNVFSRGHNFSRNDMGDAENIALTAQSWNEYIENNFEDDEDDIDL